MNTRVLLGAASQDSIGLSLCMQPERLPALAYLLALLIRHPFTPLRRP